MKEFKKVIIVFVLLLMQNMINAQINTSNVLTVVNQNTNEDTLHKKNLNNNVLLSTQVTSESVPSPENQGFDKLLIDGKNVYMKKVDNVIIEYRPK